MDNDNITLIGMPGAGKSTLGVVLAKKLGYRFVDTDLLMQEGSRRLLSDIIEQDGVEGFIAYEDSIIAGLQCEHHVISTGGSAVYGEAAMEHLKQIGKVIFIDIDLDEMGRRLGTDLATRGIVMRDAETLEDLYRERRPLYRRYADVTIRTNGLSTREAVEELCRKLP